jgi:signal transduction histidine kinase
MFPSSDTPTYVRRSFLHRAAVNQLICLAVGLSLWLLMGRRSFWVSYGYSFLIGNLCWLLIDGGRLLAGRLLHRHTGTPSEWPGWRWMTPIALLGAVVGYGIGGTLGDALFQLESPSVFKDRAALVITLLIGTAATYFWYSRQMLRVRHAEAEAARRQAAETQLRLLQSQLEPHMLFNTLANLRVLIGLDPARAQEMLDRLIGFLRSTLGASRATLHPLQAEFDRTADYLALMAVRMGARLSVELDLPPELAALPVPPLLLQPVVENAIQHGLEPKVAGGRIVVRARRQADRLVLTVRDTGLGLPPAPGPAEPGHGFGTQQVRERLATLYGDAASFTLVPASGEDGGTLATLALPLGVPAPATTSGDAR